MQRSETQAIRQGDPWRVDQKPRKFHQNEDGRDKPGHENVKSLRLAPNF
jgi:hypothetical protein